MRAQRIKTGFHRIGLIVAVLCGVPSILGVAAAFPAYLGWFPSADSELWLACLAGGAAGLVLAALGYAAAWALGWVIAGFAGDDPI